MSTMLPIIAGAGLILLGIVLLVSSIKNLSEVRSVQSVYEKHKYDRQPFPLKHPTATKTVLVFIWHYSGYLSLALGAVIIIITAYWAALPK